MNRLAVLAAAPHRVFFFVGAAQGVAAIVWWLADLAGRYGGWYASPAWTVRMISPRSSSAAALSVSLMPKDFR